MRALVDDLLLLTRLESSPALDPVQIGEVDVPSLVRRIVADASQLSDDRHRFNVDVDAELRLRGVESELHSAFGNLVANAVRYSPEGGDIKVRWYHTDAGARFEVEDQGVGIQPEHLSRITERFYRIDLAGSRVRGGTGLGLSIVKHVLKRHDSGLEVRSEFGQGSRFYWVFPPQFSIPVNRG
jgi:two-component system phosphate regulon sensor histidine kinase PhoR